MESLIWIWILGAPAVAFVVMSYMYCVGATFVVGADVNTFGRRWGSPKVLA
jgi:hypothetical protein